MGKHIIIQPDGTKSEVERKKFDYDVTSEAVGGYIERIKVRYEGKVRDCYLNEEGLLLGLPFNSEIKKLAEDYYKVPCQQFAGPAVIWVP